MRRRILTVWLVVAIPVAAACGRSSSNATQGATTTVAQAGALATTDRAADEAALRAIYQKLPSIIASGDTAAIGALFLDNGVEIMPGAPPAQGKDAIKKQFASVLASMKHLELAMTADAVITIADAGDLAVVRAPYRMTFTDPKGKKAEDHGTSMTVFKKVAGQWKALYDTNISEVAPPQ